MFRMIILSIFAASLFILFTNHTLAQEPLNTIEEARVLKIIETKEINPQTKTPVRNVNVRILTGPLKDKEFKVIDNIIQAPFQLKYKTGDKVIVTVSKSPGGKTGVYISDVDRKPMMLLLFAIFVVFTIAVSRWQGVSSLIGMAISFYVIAAVMIPNIFAGNDPLLMAVFSSLIILPATFYLAHGINRKTNVAVISSFITLVFAGGLAYVFTELTRLTGMTTEEAVFLSATTGTTHIDIKNLLLAGILIGFLAIMDDITISQASVVESLYKSNPKLTFKELFGHAMAVGRDHVASLVNTLVLVYVGASFPLILLFYNTQTSIGLVANQEIIATEIVRTLVGSIGIIAAVPVSTYLACVFVKKN
jgi:uncharacterized membrane protein